MHLCILLIFLLFIKNIYTDPSLKTLEEEDEMNEEILPRMYSIVPSNTRFNSGSKPFKTPLAENSKQFMLNSM